MIDKNRHTSSRIPIRFVDEESRSDAGRGTPSPDTGDKGDADALTPDELGRASSYEDATEMQRRIDRGNEGDDAGGRDEADGRDTAGGPNRSEMPESREDKDTKPPSAGVDSAGAGGATESGEGGDAPRQADASAGPVMAELVATRAELRRVQTELQKAKEERQDFFDKLTRRQADFENYRKRVERERQETYSNGVREVIGQLLPVVDNLQRALDAEATFRGSESEEFRHFLQGVELISKQLNNVLAGLGVQTVETVGQPFDPHVHEAIAVEESGEFAPDFVMAEIVRGYRLGDKLLRPAMVKVAK